MTEVFIVGEDPVTQEILRRLIKDYAPNLVVNSALLPYIRTKWNVENARKNSYSLDRTILRIQSL